MPRFHALTRGSLVATLLWIGMSVCARAAEPAAPAISLTGTVSSKSITTDELLRFTLTVENKSPLTLSNFRLAAPPDGYTWQKIHAQGVKGDAYYETAKAFEGAGNLLFPSVPPGATYTAWGYLTPTVSHKTSSLTSQAEWTAGSEKAATTLSTTVEFGENAVQGQGDILWGYVTILALPIVLALLPFAINNILKRRDDRSETLRLMLTQSLEYAAKYYLPLSAAAQRLVDALQPAPRAGQAQPPNALSSFYYVVYLEKRMTEQRKAVGGFYFKDLRAEMLASFCWKAYSEAVFGKDPTDDFNRGVQACVNKLKDRENFDAFAKKLEMNAAGVFANGDAQRAWLLFQTKLTEISIPSLILDLNTLQALIDYEVNRPFENWYPTAAPPLRVEKDVKQRLMQLAKKLNFTAEQMEYVDAVEVLTATE